MSVSHNKDSKLGERQQSGLRHVDLVLVDDNELMIQSFTTFLFKDRPIDTYTDPNEFIANIDSYSKDTIICLDNDFDNANISGIELAELLHEKGFTRLYLLSGLQFADDEIPDYLTVIRKSDFAATGALAKL